MGNIVSHLLGGVFTFSSYFYMCWGHSRTNFRWHTHGVLHTILVRPGYVLWVRSFIGLPRSHVYKIPGWFNQWFFGKAIHCIRIASARFIEIAGSWHNILERYQERWCYLVTIKWDILEDTFFSLFITVSVINKFGNTLSNMGFYKAYQQKSLK